MAATQVLVTWLERGDCTRRNANTFYSMVQSVNSHIRRLLNEKAVHDNELEQMKFKFRQRLEGILHQCKFFSVVCNHALLRSFPLFRRKFDIYRIWRKISSKFFCLILLRKEGWISRINNYVHLNESSGNRYVQIPIVLEVWSKIVQYCTSSTLWR